MTSLLWLKYWNALIQTTPAFSTDFTNIFNQTFSVVLKNFNGKSKIGGKNIKTNWINLIKCVKKDFNLCHNVLGCSIKLELGVDFFIICYFRSSSLVGAIHMYWLNSIRVGNVSKVDLLAAFWRLTDLKDLLSWGMRAYLTGIMILESLANIDL